jgi:hypothetical protein
MINTPLQAQQLIAVQTQAKPKKPTLVQQYTLHGQSNRAAKNAGTAIIQGTQLPLPGESGDYPVVKGLFTEPRSATIREMQQQLQQRMDDVFQPFSPGLPREIR